MSYPIRAAHLACQLRLAKMNAHLNPDKARRDIQKLEFELEKVPLSLRPANFDDMVRDLWVSQYAAQVVSLEDGYVDLEDLPPIVEGGGYDGVPLDQAVAPAAPEAVEQPAPEQLSESL